MLATHQNRFLHGLARLQNAGPISREFLDASGIANAATSLRAMTAMLEKGVLWHRGTSTLFSNPSLALLDSPAVAAHRSSLIV